MTIGTIASRLVDLARALDRTGTDHAWAELRKFGESLHVVGGADLLVRAYDTAIDRHGFDSLPGVNACWHGIQGWEQA